MEEEHLNAGDFGAAQLVSRKHWDQCVRSESVVMQSDGRTADGVREKKGGRKRAKFQMRAGKAASRVKMDPSLTRQVLVLSFSCQEMNE